MVGGRGEQSQFARFRDVIGPAWRAVPAWPCKGGETTKVFRQRLACFRTLHNSWRQGLATKLRRRQVHREASQNNQGPEGQAVHAKHGLVLPIDERKN